MLQLRQISATGTPSARCFGMNAFRASENVDAFIVFHSPRPRAGGVENSSFKRSSLAVSHQRQKELQGAGGKECASEAKKTLMIAHPPLLA